MSEAFDVFPGTAAAPRNQWYVIAFSREITRQPLKREIMDEPVVLYRTQDGAPVALFDRCPHRGMPLSKGTLVGDRIQCNYHGFEYTSDGRCQLVPTSDVTPSGLQVRAYPLVEIWQWVWIWMGEPDKADPLLIPDHDELGLTASDFRAEPGVVLTVAANYLMVMENFADTTHLPYLHGFGLYEKDEEMQVDGGCVRTRRVYRNEKVEPFMQMFGVTSDYVDRTLIHMHYPPHVVVARTLFADVKGVEPLMDNRWIQAYTPAGVRQTHVFASVAQNYVNPMHWDDFPEVMRADYEVLEEIQRLMDALPPQSTPQFNVPADRSNLVARRILATMLEQ